VDNSGEHFPIDFSDNEGFQFFVDPFVGRIVMMIPAPMICFEDVDTYKDFIGALTDAIPRLTRVLKAAEDSNDDNLSEPIERYYAEQVIESWQDLVMENFHKKVGLNPQKNEAQRLYTRDGKSITQISESLGIPISTLQGWCDKENWTLERWSLEAVGNELAAIEEPVESIKTQIEVFSELEDEARTNLLRGLRLISSAGEEALQNDKIKFKDKKQAADVMMEGLRGEVELENTRLTAEFFRAIAVIIQEEVRDEDTLRRLATRLTEVGNIFDNRISANQRS